MDREKLEEYQDGLPVNSDYELYFEPTEDDHQGFTVYVTVDYFRHTPPSGRSAQACETPEEYYGDTELEYSIDLVVMDDGTEVSGYEAEHGPSAFIGDTERDEIWDAIVVDKMGG
jgi:hypothetical protein